METCRYKERVVMGIVMVETCRYMEGVVMETCRYKEGVVMVGTCRYKERVGMGLCMVGYNFNFSLVVTHALKSLRWTLQNAWKMEKVEG